MIVKKIKSMTYDQISDWARILTAIVGLFTFAALIVTTWATIKANKEKEVKNKEQQERIEQLRNDTANLEKDVIAAKTKQTEAERQLLELQERAKPRRVSVDFLSALQNKPVGKVEILYDPTVSDAYNPLAMSIETMLSGAGWEVISVEPISFTKTESKYKSVAPPITQVGGAPASGLTINGKLESTPFESDTPYSSLFNAFKASGLHFSARLDNKLPTNSFRIVISSRPHL